MTPWVDRKALEQDAKDFVKKHGYYIRRHAKRISGLVEVAVYNSIVSFYEQEGYQLAAEGLGPKKSFVYKLSAAGLTQNFSRFRATKPTAKEPVLILQNTKIQSAHHAHLYYTPDVSVAYAASAVTERVSSKRRHSFVKSHGLLTFIEVKHLTPFPEVLFSFTGLVLEFSPKFILGRHRCSVDDKHLAPMLVFTGPASKYSETIKSELGERYGINIVFGTQRSDGKVTDFTGLFKHSPVQRGNKARSQHFQRTKHEGLVWP